MNKVDYLVIGGSAAGTTAAEVIRSIKPDSSITIVTDENHEQYSRVLLPHYIRGKVKREQVFLKKQEWYQDKQIELIKLTKVIKLEPSKHQVNLSDGTSIEYGKLLIAIGGYVVKLDVSGSDAANILYMRTVEDADKIVKVASQSHKAVIIGGGFIGLEFMSCFKANGVSDVTVLVKEDYYWQGKLDEKSSKVLQNTLEKNGIKIMTNEEIDHFDNSNNQSKVVTKSGKDFLIDVVGIGIGIRSDLSWLDGSGIKINRAIVTNEYLETNVADIYAAGDCAEFHDVIFGRQHIMGNWANATSQGNAVGRTMGNQRTVFETASSYSINFFDPPVGEIGGACTFIGVTDADFADQIIVRGSVENQKMTRIFIKKIDGLTRIVGATLINNPAEVSPLTTAVKSKTDVAVHKDKLGDLGFDLREIIADL